jgi:hypothetical protein
MGMVADGMSVQAILADIPSGRVSFSGLFLQEN